MAGQIEDMLQRGWAGLAVPAHAFIHDGDVRYYWVYLAVVPLILAFMALRGGPEAASVKRVFEKDTWLSKSALNDIWIFTINSVLQFSLLAGLFLSAVSVAHWAAAALIGAGLPHLLSEQGLGAMIGLTIASFLAADFGKFLAHYWAHRIPAFWELHKVHHAAEVLNPFTAERFHPIEQIIDSVIISGLVGATNGLFIALAGPALSPVTIAGANVLWVLANVAGGPIRHLPVWFSYGPAVEAWILSPAQHQIHHSEEARHFDKNLGSTLAIWDRLFGTLYVTHGVENIRYGLGDETAKFRTVAENYWRPLAAVFGMIRRPESRPAAA